MNTKNVRVIIAMRSDFESLVLSKGILESFTIRRYVVPPFRREEIRDVVCLPASQSMIEIAACDPSDTDASAFIGRICDEALQSPNALPLLSFSLQEWYVKSLEEGGAVDKLHELQYLGIGGLNGALFNILRRFMSTIKDDQEKAILKRLALRMVTINDGTFTKVRIYDRELNKSSELQSKIIERLIAFRIVSSDQLKSNEKYYEFAHDSVLTTWPELMEWTSKASSHLLILQKFTDDSYLWKTNKRPNTYLWKSGNDFDIILEQGDLLPKPKNTSSRILQSLLNAISYGALPRIGSNHDTFSETEWEFLNKSLKKQRKQQANLTLLNSAVVIALIISIFAITQAINQRQNANDNRVRNEAYSLGMKSESEVPPLAYFTLRKAISMRPNDPVILQMIFDLMTRRTDGRKIIPSITFPIKSPGIDDIEFLGEDHIRVQNTPRSATFNLLSGTLTEFKDDSPSPESEYGRNFIPTENRLMTWSSTKEYRTNAIVDGDKILFIDSACLTLRPLLLPFSDSLDSRICLNVKIPHVVAARILPNSNAILVSLDGGIFFVAFTTGSIIQLVDGLRQKAYTVSTDLTKLAAINAKNELCVWNLDDEGRLKNAKLDDIIVDTRLDHWQKYSSEQDSILTYKIPSSDSNTWKTLSFPYKEEDMQFLVAASPNTNEFIIRRSFNMSNFIVDESSKPMIQLPRFIEPYTFASMGYSKDGESIGYIGTNIRLEKVTLQQFPSLKHVKDWIFSYSPIVGDSIKISLLDVIKDQKHSKN